MIAPESDDIHPRVLIEVIERRSEILTHISDRSLELGQVSVDWRIANGTLFKKGSREYLGMESYVWKTCCDVFLCCVCACVDVDLVCITAD